MLAFRRIEFSSINITHPFFSAFAFWGAGAQFTKQSWPRNITSSAAATAAAGFEEAYLSLQPQLGPNTKSWATTYAAHLQVGHNSRTSCQDASLTSTPLLCMRFWVLFCVRSLLKYFCNKLVQKPSQKANNEFHGARNKSFRKTRKPTKSKYVAAINFN